MKQSRHREMAGAGGLARLSRLVWPAVIILALCCARPPSSVIVICAGDSLTEQGYPRMLQTMMRQDGTRSRVLNYGRSGFTSGEYLIFLRRAQGEMAFRRPDFILLELGTNDVRLDGDHTPTERFERNMRDIIGIFRQLRTRDGLSPRILLGTIPPVPEQVDFPFGPESSRRARDEINPAVRRLAQEEGLALVDNYSLFLDLPGLLPDVHPSEEGYRRLARNWYQALGPFLRRSP